MFKAHTAVRASSRVSARVALPAALLLAGCKEDDASGAQPDASDAHDAGSSTSGNETPVVVGDRVYATSAGATFAIDADSGMQLWRAPIGATASPAYAAVRSRHGRRALALADLQRSRKRRLGVVERVGRRSRRGRVRDHRQQKKLGELAGAGTIASGAAIANGRVVFGSGVTYSVGGTVRANELHAFALPK